MVGFFFPLPGHVRTRGDPQIAIWRSNALELSRPREAPPQEDAAALRPADGRASPSARRRRARRPTAYRKRRSPPPPPGQSAGKPPTTAGHPRKRRRARGGGGGRPRRPPAPTRASLTSQARPPRRPVAAAAPTGRAGQGWAGLGRAASRSHSQLLESPHSRHRTLQAGNCPSPRSASLQALRGSGAGQPPRRSHRAASRTGNNRKGAGP